MNDTVSKDRASQVIEVISWTLIVSFFCWSLGLVYADVRDGGLGDESHRLLIAYRLQDDLSPTWRQYLHDPWPPLPYILQVLTHRTLKATCGFTDQHFIRSALTCSTVMFGLHLAAVVMLCRRCRASLAGLFYVAAVVSSGSLVKLGISAMAEAPALFFVSVAGLFLMKRSVWSVLVAGLLFCAASLCRTEIGMFSVCLCVLLLISRGFICAACFGLTATAATIFKTLYTMSQASGMSYLNLRDYCWLGDSLAQRLAYMKAGFLYIWPINHYAVVLFGIVSALFAIRMTLAGYQLVRSRLDLKTAVGGSGFGAAVAMLGLSSVTLIFGIQAAGFISWDTRYQLMPICIALLGLSILACRNRDASPLLTPRIRAGFALAIAALVATFGAYGSVSSYETSYAAIPVEMREGCDAMMKTVSADRLVVIDALMFWDVYPLMHSEIRGQASRSASVYDHPQVKETPGMALAIAAGESAKAVNLAAYTDQFEPGVYVSGGPGTRKRLKDTARFIDKQERASYLYDFISWTDENNGILSLSHIGSEKRFAVKKLFENETIAVHDLRLLKDRPTSASVATPNRK